MRDVVPSSCESIRKMLKIRSGPDTATLVLGATVLLISLASVVLQKLPIALATTLLGTGIVAAGCLSKLRSHRLQNIIDTGRIVPTNLSHWKKQPNGFLQCELSGESFTIEICRFASCTAEWTESAQTILVIRAEDESNRIMVFPHRNVALILGLTKADQVSHADLDEPLSHFFRKCWVEEQRRLSTAILWFTPLQVVVLGILITQTSGTDACNNLMNFTVILYFILSPTIVANFVNAPNRVLFLIWNFGILIAEIVVQNAFPEMPPTVTLTVLCFATVVLAFALRRPWIKNELAATEIARLGSAPYHRRAASLESKADVEDLVVKAVADSGSLMRTSGRASLASQISQITVGAILDDRYEILSKLGDGGAGSVYRAKDLELKRIVAIKTLHTNALVQQEDRARFKREAKLLAQINNSHVAKIFRIGQLPTLATYLIMEYADGKSLKSLLNERELSLFEFLSIAIQICKGLDAIHSAGIVHRDLNPGNVIVSPDKSAKIIDFGLSKSLPDGILVHSQKLTSTGLLMGTPAYMSPEQCMGEVVLASSDIYSLGCLFYEMLCGHAPFECDSPIGLVGMHVNATPLQIVSLRGETPVPLNDLVMKCLSKKPVDRPSSAKEVAETLNPLLRMFSIANEA